MSILIRNGWVEREEAMEDLVEFHGADSAVAGILTEQAVMFVGSAGTHPMDPVIRDLLEYRDLMLTLRMAMRSLEGEHRWDGGVTEEGEDADCCVDCGVSLSDERRAKLPCWAAVGPESFREAVRSVLERAGSPGTGEGEGARFAGFVEPPTGRGGARDRLVARVAWEAGRAGLPMEAVWYHLSFILGEAGRDAPEPRGILGGEEEGS